jgi:hypothetical protein
MRRILLVLGATLALGLAAVVPPSAEAGSLTCTRNGHTYTCILTYDGHTCTIVFTYPPYRLISYSCT